MFIERTSARGNIQRTRAYIKPSSSKQCDEDVVPCGRTYQNKMSRSLYRKPIKCPLLLAHQLQGHEKVDQI